MKCDRDRCRAEAYWMLPDGRGFCTAVHLNDTIGRRQWTAGPVREDHTRLVRVMWDS